MLIVVETILQYIRENYKEGGILLTTNEKKPKKDRITKKNNKDFSHLYNKLIPTLPDVISTRRNPTNQSIPEVPICVDNLYKEHKNLFCSLVYAINLLNISSGLYDVTTPKKFLKLLSTQVKLLIIPLYTISKYPYLREHFDKKSSKMGQHKCLTLETPEAYLKNWIIKKQLWENIKKSI